MRLLLIAVTLLAFAAPSIVQACEQGKSLSVQAPSTTTIVQAPQTPVPPPSDGNEG
jgi:hypothetical protein